MAAVYEGNAALVNVIDIQLVYILLCDGIHTCVCVSIITVAVSPRDMLVTTISSGPSTFLCSTSSPNATIISVEWFINDVQNSGWPHHH